MKSLPVLGALAVALMAASSASAQFVPPTGPMPQVEGKMPPLVWSAKKDLTPYEYPNKPIWRISEILAAHKGEPSWVQPIVRNSQQEADYISMAPGEKTKPKFWADDRIVFIVQSGALKVDIEGAPEFTATRGFMVSVPFRHVYTLEAVGSVPAVRFEVRHTGEVPEYPADVTPDPIPGYTYEKVHAATPPAKLYGADGTNPIYVDFWKDVAIGNKTNGGKFVWDDNFTSNILRGPGAPVPPDTNLGHFHTDWTEFWYVMEGKIGIKIEGIPYFVGGEGDIITAQQGRWHRAGDDPSAPMSTRIPFNPRPVIMHNFQPTPDAK
jgi:mannose-6-phosphate isomerase-like protein (cupin superfamily)